MDLSKPVGRWAIVTIVIVAIAVASVGVVASTQPERIAKAYTATTIPCAEGYTPGTPCTSYGQAEFKYTGVYYPQNSSVIAPERSRYWYFGGGVVLVVGLLVVWVASARRRGQSES